jgi:hypothetical protein
MTAALFMCLEYQNPGATSSNNEDENIGLERVQCAPQ